MNKKAIDEAVKKNIEDAQKKQKEYNYDKNHGCSSCYSTGSLVWKMDFLRKKTAVVGYWMKSGRVHTESIASPGKGLFRLQELHVNGEKVFTVVFYTIADSGASQRVSLENVLPQP